MVLTFFSSSSLAIQNISSKGRYGFLLRLFIFIQIAFSLFSCFSMCTIKFSTCQKCNRNRNQSSFQASQNMVMHLRNFILSHCNTENSLRCYHLVDGWPNNQFPLTFCNHDLLFCSPYLLLCLKDSHLALFNLMTTSYYILSSSIDLLFDLQIKDEKTCSSHAPFLNPFWTLTSIFAKGQKIEKNIFYLILE